MAAVMATTRCVVVVGKPQVVTEVTEVTVVTLEACRS
jgi:hypothetical protein